MPSVWGELKRRNVFKVAVAYAVVGWLLIEIASTVLPTFEAPQWALKTMTFLILAGFPLALILSWAFDLTPDGLERTESAPDSENLARFTGRKLDFVIIGLLALALGFLVLDNYVFRDVDPLEGLVDVSDPVPGFSDRAAIAVLPFLNISGDPEQEYFSDGITEDLITGLQAIGKFPIIARTSTFSYKGQAKDVREIAEALGAGYILEGSVRRAADQVRITAQLIDATGMNVWAEAYDSQLDDIFAVQDEIRQQIIGAIEPELLLAEMDRAAFVQTEDMQAWDYYLQAAADATSYGGYVDRFGQPVTIERTRRALRLARKAIELDPTFADAYTLLGHINSLYSVSLRGQVGDEIADQTMRDAIEYTRRGRELSPFSATACSCYVSLLAWAGLPELLDLETAVEIQQDAVRLNPANAIAHVVLGKVYQMLGRYEEALLEVQIAKRLSPRDVDLSWFLTVQAAIHLGLGDLESAADVAQSAALLTPMNLDAHAIRIAALYALADSDAATSAVDFMRQSIPDFSVNMLWNDPLPESLMPSVSSLVRLQDNPGFRQAVEAILEDLGWAPEV